MATLAREPLVMPAPRSRQIGAVDCVPNLLVTTLAVVAATLPVGKQLFDSAPRAKPAVYAQQQYNTVALGITAPPSPKALQHSVSAPQATRRIGLDATPNLLATTLADTALNPSVTIDLGGYQPKAWIGFDAYPNLLQTTLGTVPVQPVGKQLSTSAPYPKAQVRVDTTPNMLALGINPNPRITQLDTSAPWVKYQPKVDAYPNLSLTTLAPIVFPAGAQLSTSAPFPKYAIKVDAYPNTLALGINPQPKVMQWSVSAPPPKYAVQVDRYPNLATSTLYVPPVFPVGKQLSDSSSTNTAKYQLRVDVPTNYSGAIPASFHPKLFRRYRFPDYPVPPSQRRRR